MLAWMLQWNLYVPGFGATNVADAPAKMFPVSKAPPSAARVCVVESAFLTVTFWPVFTLIGAPNAKLLMVIVAETCRSPGRNAAVTGGLLGFETDDDVDGEDEEDALEAELHPATTSPKSINAPAHRNTRK
jgi:hypothetical protein